MANIPGFDIICLRNGVDISNHVVSGRTSISLGKYTRSWEIEFAEPMDILTTDVWTVRRKLACYTKTWCENALAVNWGGDDGVDSSDGNVIALRSTRRVSGEAATEAIHDLLNYCVPKTLVFVNEDWLLSIYPTAQVVDGILVYGGSSPFGLPSNRIYDPRFPGKEYEADSFECIVGVQTHHDIAKYLARLVGFELFVSTPNVPIIDTMTIQSGTTWIDAIRGIFQALWLPHIEIIESTIYVMDVLAGNTAVPAVQKMRLTNDAIASASLNRGGPDKENPVDHLIITGRKTNETTVLQPETPDYTAVDLPELTLASDLEVVAMVDFSGLQKYKLMEQYDGTFGIPGEEITPSDVKTQTRTMTFYTDKSSGRLRYIPIQETVNTFDGSDLNVARQVTNHYYAKGYVPVRTTEKHYVYTSMPGSETKALTLLSTKTTKQRHCKRAMNQTLTEEIFEGLVLYEKVTIDEVEYKTDPMVLSEVLRADTTQSIIDTEEDTKQDVLEMTISERGTIISRVDDDLLLKFEQTRDTLTGHTRSNSQILENPMRDREKNKSDHKFRKEYHDGSGKLIGGYGPCYHPAKTIHHDDICTEALADQIAARLFARKNIDKNHEWSIKIPFPVPIESLAMVVALPDFRAYVNGVLTTIPGGDFVLKSVSESFSYTEVRPNVVDPRPETTLVVRKRY